MEKGDSRSLATGYQGYLIEGWTQSFVARIVNAQAASLSPIHQRITQEAVQLYETRLGSRDAFRVWQHRILGVRNSTLRLNAKRLLGGVLWADTPVGAVQEYREYVGYPLEFIKGPVDQHDAMHMWGFRGGIDADDEDVHVAAVVTDERFAYQPTKDVIGAMVRVYMLRSMGTDEDLRARAHAALARSRPLASMVEVGDPMAGVEGDDELLQWLVTFGPEQASALHAMAAVDTRRTVAELAALCVDKTIALVTNAIDMEDLHYVGRALHLVQDSYALGHMERTSTGSITMIYAYHQGGDRKAEALMHTFGDSAPAWNLVLDSRMRARCVEACVALLEAFDQGAASSKNKAIAQLRVFLEGHVFMVADEARHRKAGAQLVYDKAKF